MVAHLRNVIAPYFHAFVCLHHVIVVIYSNVSRDLRNVTDERVLDMERFAPVFFTSWNLVLQTTYFALAFTRDVLLMFSARQDLQEKIMRRKGYVFTSLMFPSTMFVFTMFWSIYNLNREWVLPEVLDEYIPEWLNHSIHTNILIFLIVEVLIVNQLLPTFKSAFYGLTTMFAIYHSIFICSYFLSGRWAYGIFYIFTWPERILFMFANYLFSLIVMKVGMRIQNFKHSLSKANMAALKESAKVF